MISESLILVATVYNKYYHIWEAKPRLEKTWFNFKMCFGDATRWRKIYWQATTKEGGYHNTINATEEPPPTKANDDTASYCYINAAQQAIGNNAFMSLANQAMFSQMTDKNTPLNSEVNGMNNAMHQLQKHMMMMAWNNQQGLSRINSSSNNKVRIYNVGGNNNNNNNNGNTWTHQQQQQQQ